MLQITDMTSDRMIRTSNQCGIGTFLMSSQSRVWVVSLKLTIEQQQQGRQKLSDHNPIQSGAARPDLLSRVRWFLLRCPNPRRSNRRHIDQDGNLRKVLHRSVGGHSASIRRHLGSAFCIIVDVFHTYRDDTTDHKRKHPIVVFECQVCKHAMRMRYWCPLLS